MWSIPDSLQIKKALYEQGNSVEQNVMLNPLSPAAFW